MSTQYDENHLSHLAGSMVAESAPQMVKTIAVAPPPMLGIKALAEADRPREKMLERGRAALTDAELLAILIGSGTPGESAVQLAQNILRGASNNLHDLGKCTLKELQRHKGIGEAKAITIAAALELGRRRNTTLLPERQQVTCSKDLVNYIAPFLNDLRHEEFWLIYLSRDYKLMGKECITTGGTAGTVVDIKLVLKRVIEANASTFVAVHNHPSGSLKPSQGDLSITKRMLEAGALIQLPLFDHIIISEKGYYSFADKGWAVTKEEIDFDAFT